MRKKVGIRADCDTNADIIELLTEGRTPLEVCGIINKLLIYLLFEGIRVRVGDGTGSGYLDCIMYNPDNDGLYLLTENFMEEEENE